MKRGFHLLGQVAVMVVIWAVIFEIGLRMQQYCGPLYDLEMVNINLNWESDVLNHMPATENPEPLHLRRSDGLQLQEIL
jgi:hypothetical protein